MTMLALIMLGCGLGLGCLLYPQATGTLVTSVLIRVNLGAKRLLGLLGSQLYRGGRLLVEAAGTSANERHPFHGPANARTKERVVADRDDKEAGRSQGGRVAVAFLAAAVGTSLMSAAAVIAASSEAGLLILTLAPMLQTSLPFIPPWVPLALMATAGVTGLLFWGAAFTDVVEWSDLRLYRWPEHRSSRTFLVALSVTMLVLLLFMLIAAALYRHQIMALMGGRGADETTLLRLQVAVVVVLAVQVFATAVIAGMAIPRFVLVSVTGLLIGASAVVVAGIAFVLWATAQGAGVTAETARAFFTAITRERKQVQLHREAKRAAAHAFALQQKASAQAFLLERERIWAAAEHWPSWWTRILRLFGRPRSELTGHVTSDHDLMPLRMPPRPRWRRSSSFLRPARSKAGQGHDTVVRHATAHE